MNVLVIERPGPQSSWVIENEASSLRIKTSGGLGKDLNCRVLAM